MSSASPASVDIERVRRTNNFDALRLLGALGVVLGHGQILRGDPAHVPTVLGISSHYFGVSIFFAISGWLITGSWQRSRSVAQYVSSRALRLLPLLWLVVLLSVLVLGPAVTTLPLGAYFRSGQTWHYLVNLVGLPAEGVPGVFAGVPYPGAVNGSLWTLRAEVACYLVVLLLGQLSPRWQTAGFVVFALGAVALIEAGDVRVAGSSLTAAGTTWIYFAVAATFRLRLPRRLLRADVAGGVVAVWALVWLVGGSGASLKFSWLALPYVVVSIGLASWPGVRRAARFGDLSYGLYIFAFPVQQLVVEAFGPMTPVAAIGLAALGSGALAYCSWHVLEKPALDLRRRLPWFATSPTSTPEPLAGGVTPVSS